MHRAQRQLGGVESRLVIGRTARNEALLARLSLVARLVNFGLAISFLVLWIRLGRQDAFWRADFTAFYTGWAIVSDGQGARLYDPDLHARYQRRILAGRSYPDMRYDYPPPAAVLFAPLAWLPRSSAFLLWTFAQVLLLLWLLRLLLGIARGWTAEERRSMISAVLAFPPLLFTFQLGAFSLLTVVCVLQACLALERARDSRAGLWLAVGTLKPQAVLQPAWMLLGGRRWRAVLSLSSAVVAMVVVSTLLLGWQAWPEFVRAIGEVSVRFDADGIVPAEMYNIKGALTSLLGNDHGKLINGLSTIALLAASAATLAIWRRAGSSESGFRLRMALTILLGILSSPHLYPQDSLMLVVPAVLLYAHLRDRGLPHRAYAALAMSGPLLFAIADSIIGDKLGVRPPIVLIALLTAWAAKWLADERPEPSRGAFG